MVKKPAKIGLDYVRDGEWQPIKKTAKSWKQWAKKYSEDNGIIWDIIITEFDDYFRINFTYQNE